MFRVLHPEGIFLNLLSMNIRIFILLLLFCLPASGHAQKSLADSIENLLSVEKPIRDG